MILPTEDNLVYIEGLTIKTVIGLYDWERKIKQPVVIDMVLYTDVDAVAQSHNLAKGVNYKAVCDDVTLWTQELKAELVEELAEHLAGKILAEYQVSKITIKVGKPIAITETKMVGVQITRSN